jgi:hypothetical protein
VLRTFRHDEGGVYQRDEGGRSKSVMQYLV